MEWFLCDLFSEEDFKLIKLLKFELPQWWILTQGVWVLCMSNELIFNTGFD